MAAADEPLVLPVGTEVSAKYRGAFCEAKVKKIVRVVKCKVNITDPKQQITVLDEDIKGNLKVGSKVEVKLPDSGLYVEATISKLTDCSQYTVVFNDGDENTLRRTQLCLKGEKHFVKSETLDQLPLTHPEHFGTPVMKGYKGQKRRRPAHQGGASVSESESESESSECSSPRKKVYKGRLHDQIGRVLCMELEDRKKTNWVPVLVVLPSATDMDLKTRDHLLVKSFKDGRFYSVQKGETKDFVRDMAVKNEDKSLKPAMEKALAYFDTRDLPNTWDREELLGEDSDDDDDSDTSDDEPSEEKDHFVAQLYKFMDDRGTPINKAPTIGSQDLNLYRLFRLVRNFGGYNKVTNLIKWKLVYSKMNLSPSSNAYNQIKTAYKKFLHAYEDFYRKLGSTMGNSRAGRTRHSSGRSLLPFRERDAGQPKSPRSEKKKEEKDTEESDDDGKGKDGADKPADVKGKKEEKKAAAAVKEEAEDADSPRKRRSRAGPDKKAEDKKKEEEKEERVTKRMTREDTAKLKEESKVKAEEEKSRRGKKVEQETEEQKEDVRKKKKVPTATLR